MNCDCQLCIIVNASHHSRFINRFTSSARNCFSLGFTNLMFDYVIFHIIILKALSANLITFGWLVVKEIWIVKDWCLINCICHTRWAAEEGK